MGCLHSTTNAPASDHRSKQPDTSFNSPGTGYNNGGSRPDPQFTNIAAPLFDQGPQNAIQPSQIHSAKKEGEFLSSLPYFMF